MIGFNSFFLFLFAFPLEAVLVTCFAFWIAACFIWEPFILLRCGGGCEEVGRQEGFLVYDAGFRSFTTVPGPPQRRKAGEKVLRG